MTPRRIAYVVQDFPKLSETFIAGELAELRRRGVAVRILARKNLHEPLRHSFIADEGLDRLVVYGTTNFSAALLEFQPDLLHAHYSTRPTECARALAEEFGVPFTFTAHGSDIYLNAPPDFAERAAAAAALITVSEANAQYIAKSFNVPRETYSCDSMRRRYRDLSSARTQTGSRGKIPPHPMRGAARAGQKPWIAA